MKKLIVLMIVLLIAGCSQVSQKDAEKAAVDFINKNVRFFARSDNASMVLPDFSIDSMSSYLEGEDWMVVMHVTAVQANETKKADITVKVGKDGKPIELNGKIIDKRQLKK